MLAQLPHSDSIANGCYGTTTSCELQAHIKRGKIVLVHLPRQPCATYCKSRLALWLMLVPVSYHEPFASSKHQTMIIAGTYKARQDCPGAFATPTLCHILQKQTCFVADACPCQLPWAVCKQKAPVAQRHQDLYFWIVAGTYKARQDCPGAFVTPTLCHILQKQTCFVADACPCRLPWAVCKQQAPDHDYCGHI